LKEKQVEERRLVVDRGIKSLLKGLN
jgi:hypothetical protein